MISPIENNGMIVRTQDFTSMRQQEDIKLSGEHLQLQQRIDEKGGDSVRTVHHSDDSDETDTRHDAKEEGKNKYFASQNAKKKSKPEGDGVVVVKGRGAFDFKI